MTENESCENCTLSTEFQNKSYKAEIWCEFHQQPKFKDDKCEDIIMIDYDTSK